MSTPSRKRSAACLEESESESDDELTKFFPPRCVEECLLPEDIEILKKVIYLCIRHLMRRKIEADCYGCGVDHPSQIQHTCLFEPPMYYFARCFDTICEWLFTPELRCALEYALKTIRGKKVSPYRLLGATEVIVGELRDEPFIIKKLDETTRGLIAYDCLLERKTPTNIALNRSVDMWNPNAL